MDSRGHGRSTRNQAPFGYDLMAVRRDRADGFPQAPKAAIVGWSDGAIIGLDIAMHHPERITKLFAFAANSDPSGRRRYRQQRRVQRLYRAGAERVRKTVADARAVIRLPRPRSAKCGRPSRTGPPADLHKIAVPTWIVDADHDEAIKRRTPSSWPRTSPTPALLIQPRGQPLLRPAGPEQFTTDVRHFLEHVKAR